MIPLPLEWCYQEYYECADAEDGVTCLERFASVDGDVNIGKLTCVYSYIPHLIWIT
jgi:hypothetical protein